MKVIMSVIFGLIFGLPGLGQEFKTQNVVLITYDGLRWQELFAGMDTTLLYDLDYTPKEEMKELSDLFWDPEYKVRRQKLLPFFWSTIEFQGQLYGNRDLGSRVNVTNEYWFSYPGYNEILAGFADDQRIASNDKLPNPNQTVLEFVNQQPGFKGKVAAFGSWDVFPYIVNEDRSGVPVNAGFESYNSDSPRMETLNQLQNDLPKPWKTVRHDAFTHRFALDYLEHNGPRLLYIAYGETDDYAHDGEYNRYLMSAHQTDIFIAEIWDWIQSEEQYRDKTTLIITTDHGRGTIPKDTWRHHGSKIQGSNQIWIAILGPDAEAMGEVKGGNILYQNQIARSVAALLDLNYDGDGKAGNVLPGH